ncbi:hypothetical protein Hte_008795 [Hypoxylon texense]
MEAALLRYSSRLSRCAQGEGGPSCNGEEDAVKDSEPTGYRSWRIVKAPGSTKDIVDQLTGLRLNPDSVRQQHAETSSILRTILRPGFNEPRLDSEAAKSVEERVRHHVCGTVHDTQGRLFQTYGRGDEYQKEVKHYTKQIDRLETDIME